MEKSPIELLPPGIPTLCDWRETSGNERAFTAVDEERELLEIIDKIEKESPEERAANQAIMNEVIASLPA